MMEHGNDKELIIANAIDHGERESPKQDASAATCNSSKRFGATHRCGYGSIQGPSKLKADPQRETHTKPAPQGPQFWLEAERGHALVIALKQISADLVPWHRSCWV